MEQTRTSLNPKWLIKIGIFLIGFPALGLWGLADVTIFYPKRGYADASLRLRNYLNIAEEQGRLSAVAVDDPAARLQELESNAEQILDAARSGRASENRRALFDAAQLEWLRSLKRMWKLTADSVPIKVSDPNGADSKSFLERQWAPREGRAFTMNGDQQAFEDLEDTQEQLDKYWDSHTPVKPLDNFDILFNWGLVFAGFLGALYPLTLIIRARSKVFEWNPDEQRLTLPNGSSFVPDDIADEGLDKSKWHKFYVTIPLKNGDSHTFDLLRYTPLEAWILEMEATRFPDDVVENGDAESEASDSQEAGEDDDA